jgi:hypothetical protein
MAGLALHSTSIEADFYPLMSVMRTKTNLRPLSKCAGAAQQFEDGLLRPLTH